MHMKGKCFIFLFLSGGGRGGGRLLGLEGRNWVQRGRVSENFGHIGDRTHAKNLLCRLGVR